MNENGYTTDYFKALEDEDFMIEVKKMIIKYGATGDNLRNVLYSSKEPSEKNISNKLETLGVFQAKDYIRESDDLFHLMNTNDLIEYANDNNSRCFNLDQKDAAQIMSLLNKAPLYITRYNEIYSISPDFHSKLNIDSLIKKCIKYNSLFNPLNLSKDEKNELKNTLLKYKYENSDLYSVSNKDILSKTLDVLKKDGYKFDTDFALSKSENFDEILNDISDVYFNNPKRFLILLNKGEKKYSFEEESEIKDLQNINFLNENLNLEYTCKESGLKSKSYYNSIDTRTICHELKEGNETGNYKLAVKLIGDYFINQNVLNDKSILIPAPQHTGNAEYTKDIAKYIQHEIHCSVADVLKCKPHDPLYEQKKEGNELELNLYLENADNKTFEFWKEKGYTPYLLDNVISTGKTFNEAQNLIPDLVPLSYSIGNFAEIKFENGKYHVENTLETPLEKFVKLEAARTKFYNEERIDNEEYPADKENEIYEALSKVTYDEYVSKMEIQTKKFNEYPKKLLGKDYFADSRSWHYMHDSLYDLMQHHNFIKTDSEIEGKEKYFWATTGRERDLIRYSENNNGLKNAKPYTFEEAKKLLMKNQYSGTYAEKFLNNLKENPFSDFSVYANYAKTFDNEKKISKLEQQKDFLQKANKSFSQTINQNLPQNNSLEINEQLKVPQHDEKTFLNETENICKSLQTENKTHKNNKVRK